jgi:hypothetical protein
VALRRALGDAGRSVGRGGAESWTNRASDHPAERVARAAIELELPFAHASGMPQPPPRLKKPALARIGKRLGAELVVVGSILALGEKARGQLRLDLEVRETRSGKTLGTLSKAGLEPELRDLAARAGEDLRRLLGIPEPSGLVERGRTQRRTVETRGTAAVLRRAAANSTDGHRRGHRPAEEVHRRRTCASGGTRGPRGGLATAGYGARARESARRAFELSSYLPIERRLSIEADYRRSRRSG